MWGRRGHFLLPVSFAVKPLPPLPSPTPKTVYPSLKLSHYLPLWEALPHLQRVSTPWALGTWGGCWGHRGRGHRAGRPSGLSVEAGVCSYVLSTFGTSGQSQGASWEDCERVCAEEWGAWGGMGPQRRLLAGPVLSVAEPAARAAGLRVLSSTASSDSGDPLPPPRD